MVGEWTLSTLADAPLEIIDGDRGANYPKQSDFNSSGYCLFLNAGNVTKEGFNFSDCAFITEQKDAGLRKGKLKRHDVVLTTRGTVGNVAYFDADVPFDNIRINSGMVILRAEPSTLLPRFLYLLVRSSGFMNQVASLLTGSAQPQLPIRDINRIRIPLALLAEQRAIAHTLGTLDDKIELNRRINGTLEAIARAIFKSWFVDFDPVRAKAEGRDPGLPKEIADLFPDSFEDSELGEIPAGWSIDTIGDILDLAYGKPLKEAERRPGPVPVFGSNGQVGWHDERLVNGPGIVVGRKGNPGTVTWSPTDFFPIDTTFYAVPKHQAVSLCFLFHALQTHDLASLGADSAVPGLNRHLVYMNQQIMPPPDIVRSFDNLAAPIYKKMHENRVESRILATLRDTLLPKLMAGEIRVREAEESVVRVP